LLDCGLGQIEFNAWLWNGNLSLSNYMTLSQAIDVTSRPSESAIAFNSQTYVSLLYGVVAQERHDGDGEVLNIDSSLGFGGDALEVYKLRWQFWPSWI
jgi:hypothetical protein